MSITTIESGMKTRKELLEFFFFFLNFGNFGNFEPPQTRGTRISETTVIGKAGEEKRGERGRQ
jgi:hypothetical protein